VCSMLLSHFCYIFIAFLCFCAFATTMLPNVLKSMINFFFLGLLGFADIPTSERRVPCDCYRNSFVIGLSSITS
jgi:hypothetical protein